jgi:hypothetical protein
MMLGLGFHPMSPNPLSLSHTEQVRDVFLTLQVRDVRDATVVPVRDGSCLLNIAVSCMCAVLHTC